MVLDSAARFALLTAPLAFLCSGCNRLSGEELVAEPPGTAPTHPTATAYERVAAEPSPQPTPVPQLEASTAEFAPLWHPPVEEREPATRAATEIMETLAEIEANLTETSYRHRTRVRHRHGVYHWDCSGMAAWFLERDAPRAFEALDDERPLARDFYDMIADSPTDRARHGWQRIARPDLVGPGDLFAWRKPEAWRDRPNTGHVGFVIETPQPHPLYENVWLMRIADATRILHEDDSRPEGGDGGFGTATMAFLFDDDDPVAYGWYGSAQDPRTFVRTRIAFGRVSR